MNRCDCTRQPAHPQTHLRHIYFNKNVSNQLPRSELESLFIECSSKSVVIQWAHPPTLHTAEDVLLKCRIFFPFSLQLKQNWNPPKHVFVYWPAWKLSYTMCRRIKFSPDYDTITFTEVFYRQRNRSKKGEVMLLFLCTRPSPVCDTVQSMGHWKHKNLAHQIKCSEGKRRAIGLTLILSDVRTPGGEDVTSIIVYLWFPSWDVFSHLHLMCCCDVNG